MKAIVTGHTRGIGAAISAKLSGSGYDVIGLSRSTGHDLSTDAGMGSIIEAASHCQVFVNNAHHGFMQVRLLYALHARHGNNQAFTMVTIGSQSSDGVKLHVHPYAIEKKALDDAVMQLQNLSRWRMIHIRPGWVDTSRANDVHVPKLHADDVANAILWALLQPLTVNISSMTIVPRERVMP